MVFEAVQQNQVRATREFEGLRADSEALSEDWRRGETTEKTRPRS